MGNIMEKDQDKKRKEDLSRKIVKEMEILPPEIIDPAEVIQVQNVLETAVPMSITTQSKIELMTVEKTDWERIENYVGKLKPISSGYQTAFGFSTGFFANAVCTLIGLYTVEPLPMRVVTIFYALIAISLAISILLKIVINKEENEFKSSTGLIEKELDTVKKKNLF
jgi:hypothetical protein